MRSTSRRTWRRAARGSAPPRGASARQGAPAELRSKKARSRSGKPRAPPPPPRPMASPIGYDASSMRWNPKTCTRLCRGRPGVVVPCACRARRARHRGRRRRSGTTARARRRRASVSVAPCVAHARVGAARRLCVRTSSFSSHKAILEGRKSDDDDVASPFTLRAVGTLVRGMISFSDAAPKP